MNPDLRESSGRACHDAYRAERAGGTLHAPEECLTDYNSDSGEHVCRMHRIVHPYPCDGCAPLLRRWENLTEAQRESFYGQARPVLAVVEPMLADLTRERDEVLHRERGWAANSVSRTTYGEALRDLDAAMTRAAETEARAEAMRVALRFIDPRNATGIYDQIADDFYRQTGLWPPGRSRPAAMGGNQEDDEKAHAAWRPFVNQWHEAFFDRALAAPTTGWPPEVLALVRAAHALTICGSSFNVVAVVVSTS